MNDNGDGGGNDDGFNSKIAVLLIGIGSAAFVITIYHCISKGWCNRRRERATSQQRRGAEMRMEVMETPTSMENSAAHLIPAYKYKKGMGLVGDEGGAGGTSCPICLNELEEGDEVKALPECMHCYHRECIDMWLYSHSNCPMCRSSAFSSPQVVLRPSLDLTSSETERLNMDPNLNIAILQNVVVRPSTM